VKFTLRETGDPHGRPGFGIAMPRVNKWNTTNKMAKKTG